jgi:putative transposase
MTPNKNWPHAPIHRLGSDGIYMITGATLHKKLLFSTPEKLTLLENEILTLAKLYSWQLEAWAVFMNHYHMVARGEAGAASLTPT